MAKTHQKNRDLTEKLHTAEELLESEREEFKRKVEQLESNIKEDETKDEVKQFKSTINRLRGDRDEWRNKAERQSILIDGYEVEKEALEEKLDECENQLELAQSKIKNFGTYLKDVGGLEKVEGDSINKGNSVDRVSSVDEDEDSSKPSDLDDSNPLDEGTRVDEMLDKLEGEETNEILDKSMELVSDLMDDRSAAEGVKEAGDLDSEEDEEDEELKEEEENKENVESNGVGGNISTSGSDEDYEGEDGKGRKSMQGTGSDEDVNEEHEGSNAADFVDSSNDEREAKEEAERKENLFTIDSETIFMASDGEFCNEQFQIGRVLVSNYKETKKFPY